MFGLKAGAAFSCGVALGLVGLSGCGEGRVPPGPTAPVAAPAIAPVAGTYTGVIQVAMTDATAGASIFYTTDGSKPSAASTLYSAPFTVAQSETVNAIAILKGASSSITSAIYIISLPPATPVISPASGVYSTTFSATITDATAGASIFYTTDGTTPTAASTPYSAPFTVSSSEVVNAIAILKGVNSGVAFATYTIALPPATPVISPPSGTYSTSFSVSMTEATAGASIFYTTDGSTPTAASTPYSAPFTAANAETVKAIAIMAGVSSGIASATYVIGTPPATPYFSYCAATYPAPFRVAILEASVGASIFYTTNGATPTAASTPYTTPFIVSTTETVNAIAVLNGISSAVGSATYTIAGMSLPAATPAFWPTRGRYALAQQVAINDTSPGAHIYYTTDGSTPTQSSALYTGPISVATSQILNAIAIAPGYTQSAPAAATYNIGPSALASNEWTWMSGNNIGYAPGVYGMLGVAAPDNVPGNRVSPLGWADNAGNFWIFGGVESIQISANDYTNYLNDLWKFNDTTGEWTWVSGSNAGDAFSVYGALGVAAPGNVPGARAEGADWIDASGKLWFLGGQGTLNSIFPEGCSHNDLWTFDPATSLWTWQGGGMNTCAVPGVYGTMSVACSTNQPGSLANPVFWVDPQGIFWLFGGDGQDDPDFGNPLNALWSFDPTMKLWTWVGGSNTSSAPGVYGTQGVASASNVPGARDSSVEWTDPDGNFWLFGGDATVGFSILNDLWKYSPSTGQWTWVSGSFSPGATGSYGAIGVPATTNTPGDRYGGVSWNDNQGNFYLCCGTGDGAPGNGRGAYNDVWRYNVPSGVWTWLNGSNTPTAYPVYGSEGVAIPSNQPGSRYFMPGWTDPSGVFWLFGGIAQFSGKPNDANDLWRYQP